MHRLLVLIIFLSCAMHAEAAVQITEFCPDPYQYDDADEYLVLFWYRLPGLHHDF